MASNDNSSNAPVWTVPSDVQPKSEKAALVEDESVYTPSYDSMPAPSAPQIGDLPPNYFDISIVPDNCVLHYNEVTPYTEPSTAVVKRNEDGVLSFDPAIDNNPDQLWLYLMTYLNEKPTLGVTIHGYHVEHYTTWETHRTADGHQTTRPVQHTRDVTDFRFLINLNGYVSQQWWRVAVVPSNKTLKANEIVSLRDAVEQYTRSEKSIKNFVCQKQLLGWNFQELRDKIKSIVYSTGYRSHVIVSFTAKNNQIAARSSSKLSRFSNSTVVRVLCVLSCLFLIFGPIYLCLRSAGSTRDRIVADYTMLTPVDQFLHMNAGMIANAVMSRSTGTYLAYVA